MGKRLKQLQKLTVSEWQVMLTAMLVLPLIALSLKTKGVKWTRHFLARHGRASLSIPEERQLEVAQSVARMVSIAANHGIYRTNCLKKSLATWWLLARRGIQSELKIGVNKDEGEFSAHAWVEYQGNVLVDTADVGKRFSAFDTHSDSRH